MTDLWQSELFEIDELERRLAKKRRELEAIGTSRADLKESILVDMLSLEATLRKGADIQKRYGEVEAAGGDESWMEVTEDLQKQVVISFGFGATVDQAVAELRRAAPRYPEIAFWVKFNRARRGLIRFNDPVPDISVAPLVPGPHMQLRDLVLPDRPLAVVSLSYS